MQQVAQNIHLKILNIWIVFLNNLLSSVAFVNNYTPE